MSAFSDPQIARTQLEKLRALCSELVPANRFYAPKLKQAQLASGIESLDEFSARMPFTTKASLVEDQHANPPYGSNLTYPLGRYTRFCQTSGTTARSLTILDTADSWDWMLGNWIEIYRAAGVQPGDRAYFAFSFGPFLGFWTAFEAGAKYGLLCIPGGGLTTPARVRAILHHRANVLCCTPTYALHLAEIAQTEGIDLSDSPVRRIIVAGEPGGSIPGVRERIEALWPGAEVLDHYGMTEVGPTALQRSGESGVLRIIESSYYAEIIDPQTGTAVKDGEVGELVLTTLGRTACPLLRYRTGDLVKRDTAKEGFALAGGIIGRSDDMVVVRGVNIYPSAIEAAVRSVPEISEYRVHVTRRGALSEISIEVETSSDSAPRQLEQALSAMLALRIPIIRASVGSLPRFELKAKRWIVKN
jgi:phenylacetate-CoA ligase